MQSKTRAKTGVNRFSFIRYRTSETNYFPSLHQMAAAQVWLGPAALYGTSGIKIEKVSNSRATPRIYRGFSFLRIRTGSWWGRAAAPSAPAPSAPARAPSRSPSRWPPTGPCPRTWYHRCCPCPGPSSPSAGGGWCSCTHPYSLAPPGTTRSRHLYNRNTARWHVSASFLFIRIRFDEWMSVYLSCLQYWISMKMEECP